MEIRTRKCDICDARHDSDTTPYTTFTEYIGLDGRHYDVCSECATRLLEPLHAKLNAQNFQRQPA